MGNVFLISLFKTSHESNVNHSSKQGAAYLDSTSRNYSVCELYNESIYTENVYTQL